MKWEDYKAFHSAVEVSPNYLDNKKDNQLLHASMGLCGESAEVSELVKKKMFGKRKPIDYDLVFDELSDVLWYLALGLRALDKDLEELMEYNANKLTARYPELLNSYCSEFKPEDALLKLQPGESWTNSTGTASVFSLKSEEEIKQGHGIIT